MMKMKTLISALLLSRTVRAQSSLMTISFFDSNTTNGQCSQNDPITIDITTVPYSSTCFNVNTTFIQTNVTYNAEGYSCLTGPCGANYTLTNAANFDTNTNYSQISYRQSGTYSGKQGNLKLQTYHGRNCKQTYEPLTPWIQWNCVDSSCSNVPYNIQSFAILPTNKYDIGKGDCNLAKVYGNSAPASFRPGYHGLLVTFLTGFLMVIV